MCNERQETMLRRKGGDVLRRQRRYRLQSENEEGLLPGQRGVLLQTCERTTIQG
jgi:hypothetical protein